MGRYYVAISFAFRLKLVMLFLSPEWPGTPFLFISVRKDLIHQAFLKCHFHETFSAPQSNRISPGSPLTVCFDLPCDFTPSVSPLLPFLMGCCSGQRTNQAFGILSSVWGRAPPSASKVEGSGCCLFQLPGCSVRAQTWAQPRSASWNIEPDGMLQRKWDGQR